MKIISVSVDVLTHVKKRYILFFQTEFNLLQNMKVLFTGPLY